MKKLLIFIFAATLAIQVVNAIKCYNCESEHEPDCEEHFEPEPYFEFDCEIMKPPRFLRHVLDSDNATGCVKKVFVEDDDRKVVRTCFFGDVNDTEIGCRRDPTLPSVVEISCSVCADTDFCNVGANLDFIIANRIMSLLAISLLILWRLLRIS